MMRIKLFSLGILIGVESLVRPFGPLSGVQWPSDIPVPGCHIDSIDCCRNKIFGRWWVNRTPNEPLTKIVSYGVRPGLDRRYATFGCLDLRPGILPLGEVRTVARYTMECTEPQIIKVDQLPLIRLFDPHNAVAGRMGYTQWIPRNARCADPDKDLVMRIETYTRIEEAPNAIPMVEQKVRFVRDTFDGSEARHQQFDAWQSISLLPHKRITPPGKQLPFTLFCMDISLLMYKIGS